MSDIPSNIRLRKQSACLTLDYEDGRTFDLSFEYLRVHSPSAEVRGHAASQAVLQHGKRSVRIIRIEPVGHYALKLFFSDGHQSGIYSWAYFRQLGEEQNVRWQAYLQALIAAGKSRDE
ncbi:MAG: gamma-butyrobetaine hydroxylase-like domain-containing protein [Woeseiaceae bacterium]